MPNWSAALRELRRVLSPQGRLVIGEVLVVDPDAIRFPVLCAAAREAGFTLDYHLGPSFAYFARFRRGDS